VVVVDVVDAQNEMRKTPPLTFGVREGVVVHALIIPVGFISPWHPVIIVVRFNTSKYLSVKKETNEKRKKNGPWASSHHAVILFSHHPMLSYSPCEQLLTVGVIHCCSCLFSCCSLLVVVWIM
jgi:hypothetical protein